MAADHRLKTSPGTPLRTEVVALSRRAALFGLMTAPALAVGGCASLMATPPGPETGAPQPLTVLIATTRKPVAGARARPWFGPDRSRGNAVTLARAQLRPTDGGLPPSGLADFAITAVEPAAAGVFEACRGRDVLVYVHGYNQTFEQAVVGAAQLTHGIGFTGATVVFSWPSRGSLLDYAYDRDSAGQSHEPLVRVFEDLLAGQETGRVNLVAHSIGSMVATAALHDLYAKRGAYAADRVGALVLASPDIDMDSFTAAIPQMGPLVAKITIVTAIDDRALTVSQIVNGGTVRVGAAQKARLESLGLLVIDGSLKGTSLLNHDLFVSDPGVRQAIHDAIGGCRGFWGCGMLTPAER